MLPRNARLTSPHDFARATKSGFRSSSPSLVTYLYLTNENTPARAGLIIRKNVGGSVVRHRVARQIRHTLQDHLHALPTGALLVVRALPTSSATIKGAIHHELTELILRLLEKARVTQ